MKTILPAHHCCQHSMTFAANWSSCNVNVLQSGDTPEIRIFVRCRTFAAPYFSRIRLLQSTDDIFAAQELLQNNSSDFCSAQEFVQHIPRTMCSTVRSSQRPKSTFCSASENLPPIAEKRMNQWKARVCILHAMCESKKS